MQVKEFDINFSDGIYLLNDIRLEDKILPKGHQLTKDDILFLKIMGIKKITGIKIEATDVPVATALGAIVPHLCGASISYTTPQNNISKIVANEDGIFICSDERIFKFNRISTNMILNVITPYKNVKKGDVIAVIEIFSPIVEQQLIEKVVYSLSGNAPLLMIEKQYKEKAAIIYSRIYNDEEETKHFTNIISKMIKSFEGLEIEFANVYDSKYEVGAVADTLQTAMASHRIVFVIPGAETNHRNGTICAALDEIVDEFIKISIPQHRAHDFAIATRRDVKIIAIPYNYDEVDTSAIDRMVRMAIAKNILDKKDFEILENIIIDSMELNDSEKESLIEPSKKNPNQAQIAAVVLTAGISARAGKNKLMLDVNGKPLFMKAVDAAIKSNAAPVYVVTGHNAEEVEKHLSGLDINIVRNHDYYAGVKTSINLGLKSVPPFCDGAILIPADMPYITVEHLNNMIETFEKGNKKQLCISTYRRKKANPVLWGSKLFDSAKLMPENANVVPTFVEHSDYTKNIEAANKRIIIDINTPYDIEQLKKALEDNDEEKVIIQET